MGLKATLVKPPEESRLNFGTFSLAVLAAGVRDSAEIAILDMTDYHVEKAVSAVLKTCPDVIGVTTMGVTSVEPTAVFVKALREAGGTCAIVAGGHGATMLPRPLLEAGADAVVCGEGEETFAEILREGISDSVKGLAFLREGSVVKTPSRPLIQPLDSLSEPARDLQGPPPEGIALVETSRGCPYQCLFCEASRFYNGIWRARSPGVVVTDIQKLVTRGATIIHIVDDNFTVDPVRAIKICELLEKGPLPLFFYFSARTDDLMRDPDLIPSLARAHFLRAGIGIETLEPDLAHYIGKPISFEDHRRTCDALRKAGIFTMASFITGLPGEPEEARERCVELAVKVGVDAAQFVPFQPLPGTPLEKGRGEPEPWAEEAAAVYTNHFRQHPLVIERLLKAATLHTVRGMLARTTLAKWVNEGIIRGSGADFLASELKEIDPGLFGT
ncbi:MAG: radical SAM protein [Theionarchaea archaeon]|nr:radical SAM protein [Theionarchaea archaeon]MBU6999631.1 radical SAM protein [Theionarchaea archaeon]